MPAGPPPVDRNVALRNDRAERRDLTVFNEIVDKLNSNGVEARAIRAMLGDDEANFRRFMAVVISSLSGDSDLLLNAELPTIIEAIRNAAELGLEPTGLSGEGAIVRYQRRAQFIPMWRGYVKRIRNSGQVIDVDCQLVYASDAFDLRLGTNPQIHHEPLLPDIDEQGNPITERGAYRGAYAWATLVGTGTPIIEWMTVADIEAVRKAFSRADGDKSPWRTSWGEMARKTVIRRLGKRLPQSSSDLRLAKLMELDARADQLASAEVMAKPSPEIVAARQRALAAVGRGSRTVAPPEPEAGVSSASPTEDATPHPKPPESVHDDPASPASPPARATDDPPWPDR